MNAKIYVYTKPVDPDSYPEGLARSVHFALSIDGGDKQPFNRNYGVLFAKGRIREDNTILPCGIRDPKIFAMDNVTYGISGTRTHENGEIDDASKGKLALWKTKDLIHFTEEESVDQEEILKLNPSDFIEIDPRIAKEALLYWSPVRLSDVTVPDLVAVSSEEELDEVKAILNYSDGSTREKKILWDKATLDFTKPGEVNIKGRITQQRFKFPLADGYGDPVIFYWEGKWYYISTNDNLDDIGIYVREADDVHGLFVPGITEHLILPFDPDRGFEQTFWAPEFHVIGGELYILFAVSGHKWGPQCHMMKFKKGGSIIDADSWEDPVRVVRQDGSPLADGPITLDMTYIKAQSGSYVTWSYRENIGTALDSGSMLYIARIDEDEPWKIVSDPVLLTRPLYGWENVSGTINNEGPYALIKDGKVYITYSGGSANAYTYALGLLTADSDAELCDLSSWTKSITPVLTFYSVEGEYGPGHNSFYENEDGEIMIAYHGETSLDGHLRCDGIRRVHFRTDGEPYFQMSASEDVQDMEVDMKVIIQYDKR